MFIEKARDAIQNCRFCLMCRHTCTVGKYTKNESDTPRAKALTLWTILEGMRSFTRNDAQIFFNCVDCHKCKEHCISKYDVPLMVEEARRDLVETGFVPEEVKKIREDMVQKGNPFGIAKVNEKALRTSDLLLFPGCEISYHSPELVDICMTLLRSAGKDAEILRDGCCGAPLKSLGFYEEAKAMGERLASKILSAGGKEILVLCPNCFAAMTQSFADLGVLLPENTQVKLYLNFFLEAIEQKKLKLKSRPKKRIAIHDPCSTGRKLQLYEAPRKILANLPGVEPVEFFLKKGESLCCGGSVISRRISPELGVYSASLVLNEAKEMGVDGIVTTCPSCRFHFNQEGKGVRVYDIIEFLAF